LLLFSIFAFTRGVLRFAVEAGVVLLLLGRHSHLLCCRYWHTWKYSNARELQFRECYLFFLSVLHFGDAMSWRQAQSGVHLPLVVYGAS
jgi:hypothetical protein